MPSTKSKSLLAGKIRPDAVKSHANDETDYGREFADLPGGVSGIAQLIEAKFDQYKSGQNQGELYCYLAGTVVEVNEDDKAFCVGRRTSLTIPCCDTKTQAGKVTTQEQHVKDLMNEFRKLGADTRECNDGEDLENVANALLEAKPFFRFSTSQSDPTPQYPNPRIWHNWNGNKDLNGYTPPDHAATAVQDETEPAQTPKVPPKPAAPAAPKSAPPKAAPPRELSLEELAVKADDSDVPSQEKLSAAALAAGIGQEDIDNAENWAAVVDAIKAAQEGAAEPSADAGADYVPVKGDVVFYTPPKAKKRVEVEVTAIFETKKVCNVKNLEDGKTIYKSVPFAELAQD